MLTNSLRGAFDKTKAAEASPGHAAAGTVGQRVRQLSRQRPDPSAPDEDTEFLNHTMLANGGPLHPVLGYFLHGPYRGKTPDQAREMLLDQRGSGSGGGLRTGGLTSGGLTAPADWSKIRAGNGGAGTPPRPANVNAAGAVMPRAVAFASASASVTPQQRADDAALGQKYAETGRSTGTVLQRGDGQWVQPGQNPTGPSEGMIDVHAPDATKYSDANQFQIRPGVTSLPPGAVAGDGTTNYRRTPSNPAYIAPNSAPATARPNRDAAAPYNGPTYAPDDEDAPGAGSNSTAALDDDEDDPLSRVKRSGRPMMA